MTPTARHPESYSFNLLIIVNPDMASLMESSGLLAAADGIGFLIFFLIAFISWLINFLSPKPPGQGGPANQRRRPQNAGQGKPVQNEIDRFLQQARELVENASKEQEPKQKRNEDIVVVEAPRRQPPQQRRTSPPPPQRRSRQEVWESQVKGAPDSQRGRGNSGKQSPSQANRGSGTPKRESSEGKPGERIAGRQMPKQASPTTSNVSIGHVGSKDQNLLAGSRVGELQSVFGAPLSQTSVHDRDQETLRNNQANAINMVRGMRSPSRVRDAVIMSEILNKPLALRRRRS